MREGLDKKKVHYIHIYIKTRTGYSLSLESN